MMDHRHHPINARNISGGPFLGLGGTGNRSCFHMDMETALAPQHRRQLALAADAMAGTATTGGAVVEFVAVLKGAGWGMHGFRP